MKDILDKNVDLADVSAITRFEFCNLNFEDSDVFNHLIEITPICVKAEAAFDTAAELLFKFCFKLIKFLHDYSHPYWMLRVVETSDAVDLI